MYKLDKLLFLFGLLLVTIACSGPPPTQPPLPTTADPTALPRPTAVPVTPAPLTDVPGGSATEIPASSTDTLLPVDAVWIFADTSVIAAAPGAPKIVLGDDPFTLNPQWIQVARNGSRIGYTVANNQGQVRFQTIDVRNGAQHVFADDPRVTIVSPRFSPDGSQLAYSKIDQRQQPDSWQFEIAGATPEQVQVLTRWVRSQPSDHLEPLAPIAWTPNGLYVERLLWFSDAPGHGIARVSPTDGSAQSIVDTDHLRTEISPNGLRAAELTGILPMGPDVDSKVTLKTIDLQTGQATPIVTDGEFWTSLMRWSPDASRLLYSKQMDLANPIDEIVITAPDGSGTTNIAFGADGLPGILHDAAWQDNNTLLLLITAESQLRLYRVPADNLQAELLVELGTFEGGNIQGVPPRILYVPS
jgi:dipeptidyl aminopeptidase/acylaminoacyl peptidase